MAELWLPGENATRTTAKGNDFATLNGVRAIVLDAVGPLAQAFEELRAKVAYLEDRLGITDTPETGGDV